MPHDCHPVRTGRGRPLSRCTTAHLSSKYHNTNKITDLYIFTEFSATHLPPPHPQPPSMPSAAFLTLALKRSLVFIGFLDILVVPHNAHPPFDNNKPFNTCFFLKKTHTAENKHTVFKSIRSYLQCFIDSFSDGSYVNQDIREACRSLSFRVFHSTDTHLHVFSLTLVLSVVQNKKPSVCEVHVSISFIFESFTVPTPTYMYSLQLSFYLSFIIKITLHFHEKYTWTNSTNGYHGVGMKTPRGY